MCNNQIIEFKKMQEQRNKIYQDFDCGLSLFLNNECSEEEYQSLISAVQNHFIRLSNQAQSIAAHNSEISLKIKKIQDLEKERLSHTITYQTYTIQTFLGDKDQSVEAENAANIIKKLEIEIKQNIDVL